MNNCLDIIPVLPSSNIDRDVKWYEEKTGFKCHFKDTMYAGLTREGLSMHLQWHADTDDDPLLGGSVVRIRVEDIDVVFNEFVQRGTVANESLRKNTAWGTHEFGFYDLNKNAIFIMQDLE